MAWLGDLCVALLMISLPDTLGLVFWGVGIKNINDSSIIDKHRIFNKPASAAVSLYMYIQIDEYVSYMCFKHDSTRAVQVIRYFMLKSKLCTLTV